VRNNWRAEKIVRGVESGRKKSGVDTVWDTMKVRVEAELRAMWDAHCVEAEELELTFSAFAFQQRTAAAKKVLNELGDEDRVAIESRLTAKKPELTAQIKQQ